VLAAAKMQSESVTSEPFQACVLFSFLVQRLETLNNTPQVNSQTVWVYISTDVDQGLKKSVLTHVPSIFYIIYKTKFDKRRLKITQTIQSLNYGIHTKKYAVKEFYATQSLEGTQSPNSSQNNIPSMVPKKSLSSSHTTHHKM